VLDKRNSSIVVMHEESKQAEKQTPRELYPVKMVNKMENNAALSNKKSLFENMKAYYESIGEDPFASLPLTFMVTSTSDPSFASFHTYFTKHRGSIWIVKPGENTNRGRGITVEKHYKEIENIVERASRYGRRTHIIQKYIENPLLYNGRKFDIRTYALATSINGNFKAYYYTEGYIRTSCRAYSKTNIADPMIHLTNDAVQKKDENYGKLESANKLSYK